MDQVAGPDGKLQPLNFDEDGDGKVSDKERDAIRGRNTWLLWGGGNETFWDWLQQKGYGLTDFLILMDSRRRGSRFADAGLINQPGFMRCDEPILGLYIDAAKPDGSAILKPPPEKKDTPAPSPEASPAPLATPMCDRSHSAYVHPDPEVFDAQGRRLAEPVYQPTPPAGRLPQSGQRTGRTVRTRARIRLRNTSRKLSKGNYRRMGSTRLFMVTLQVSSVSG
jgi:hypothetical protein